MSTTALKETIQLTDFQRKKIIRDRKIYDKYKKSTGPKTVAVEKLAKENSLTTNAIWKIIRAGKEARK
jgi:Mor family transcriptional regulator